MIQDMFPTHSILHAVMTGLLLVTPYLKNLLIALPFFASAWKEGKLGSTMMWPTMAQIKGKPVVVVQNVHPFQQEADAFSDNCWHAHAKSVIHLINFIVKVCGND